MSSRKTFGSAVKWSYLSQGAEQGLNTAFTFGLACLLGPQDFGIAAMAMAYILLIKMILEQGLVAAIIQRKDLTEEHLESVFWLNLIVSAILVVVSVSASHWWAAANHTPVLAPIIAVLTLAVPMEGLVTVQKAILQKNLDFRSLGIRSTISVLAGGVVGVVMALNHYGVWALVGKQLSTDFIGLVTIWKLTGWRPRLRFSVRSLRQLLGFSSATFVGNLGLFVNGQADALLLGLFLGPVPVGLYRLADRIVRSVVSVTMTSLQVASYPEFCRLQDRQEELEKSFLGCVRASAVMTLPALVGIAILSKPILSLLGPKWTDGADALRILALIAMVCPVTNFIGPLLQAVSKPHALAAVEWAHTAVSVAALAVAGGLLKHQSAHGQVTGIAATRIATTMVLMIPIVAWMLPRFASVRPISILKAMTSSIWAAAGAGVVALAGLYCATWLTLRGWSALAFSSVLGGIAATTILLWLDRDVRRFAGNSLTYVRSLVSAPPAA